MKQKPETTQRIILKTSILAVALVVVSAFIRLLAGSQPASAAGKPISHDAEYYILDAQHGEKWKVEDQQLGAKLAKLRKKFGTSEQMQRFLRLPGLGPLL